MKTGFVGLLALALCCVALPLPAAAQARAQERPFVLGATGSRIGVSIRELRDADLSAAKLTRAEGAFVESVQPGTPAERAGLKPGDIVVEFDGEHVRGARHFARLVEETPPGRTVPMVVNRAGARQTLSVAPEEGRLGSIDLDDLRERIERGMENMPFGIGQRNAERRLGLTLQPLSPQLAAYFGVRGGALVAEVVADSPASRANLKAGDVITAIDGRTVDQPADVVQQLRSVEGTANVDVTLMRNKQEVRAQIRLDDSRPRGRTRGAVGI